MPKLKNWGGARPGSGRPIVGKEKRQITTIALEPVLLAALERYAKQAGLSRNEAVNRLLSECLLAGRPKSVQKPLIDTPAPGDDLAQAIAALDADPEFTTAVAPLAPCMSDWLNMPSQKFGEALANELELLALPPRPNNFDKDVTKQLTAIYGEHLVNLILSTKTELTNRTFQELIGYDEDPRRYRLLALAGIEP